MCNRRMTAMLRSGGLDTAASGNGPDTWSRGAQYRARKAQCQSTGKFGKLVEVVKLTMSKGADELIAIQNPLAMLDYLATHSTYWALLLTAAFEATPCTRNAPWTIVLYI